MCRVCEKKLREGVGRHFLAKMESGCAKLSQLILLRFGNEGEFYRFLFLIAASFEKSISIQKLYPSGHRRL